MKLDSWILRKIKEQLNLTDLDIILIELWAELKQDNVTIDLSSNSLLNVVEAHATANVYKRLLNKASTRIWEKGSITLLKAISEQQRLDVGFLNTNWEVLPKEMLPRLDSYDKVSSTDPRATIAKKLGATITI